jgi:hypothetical protein
MGNDMTDGNIVSAATAILKQETETFNDFERNLSVFIDEYFSDTKYAPVVADNTENRDKIFRQLLEFLLYVYTKDKEPREKPDWDKCIKFFVEKAERQPVKKDKSIDLETDNTSKPKS